MVVRGALATAVALALLPGGSAVPHTVGWSEDGRFTQDLSMCIRNLAGEVAATALQWGDRCRGTADKMALQLVVLERVLDPMADAHGYVGALWCAFYTVRMRDLPWYSGWREDLCPYREEQLACSCNESLGARWPEASGVERSQRSARGDDGGIRALGTRRVMSCALCARLYAEFGPPPYSTVAPASPASVHSAREQIELDRIERMRVVSPDNPWWHGWDLHTFGMWAEHDRQRRALPHASVLADILRFCATNGEEVHAFIWSVGAHEGRRARAASNNSGPAMGAASSPSDREVPQGQAQTSSKLLKQVQMSMEEERLKKKGGSRWQWWHRSKPSSSMPPTAVVPPVDEHAAPSPIEAVPSEPRLDLASRDFVIRVVSRAYHTVWEQAPEQIDYVRHAFGHAFFEFAHAANPDSPRVLMEALRLCASSLRFQAWPRDQELPPAKEEKDSWRLLCETGVYHSAINRLSAAAVMAADSKGLASLARLLCAWLPWPAQESARNEGVCHVGFGTDDAEARMALYRAGECASTFARQRMRPAPWEKVLLDAQRIRLFPTWPVLIEPGIPPRPPE